MLEIRWYFVLLLITSTSGTLTLQGVSVNVPNYKSLRQSHSHSDTLNKFYSSLGGSKVESFEINITRLYKLSLSFKLRHFGVKIPTFKDWLIAAIVQAVRGPFLFNWHFGFKAIQIINNYVNVVEKVDCCQFKFTMKENF